MSDLTQLLQQAAQGNDAASQQLMHVVYQRLCDIAHRQLRYQHQATLNTHELVHEAYFHLFGKNTISWQDRNHFFAYAAKSMRHFLLNRAKAHGVQKRGSNALHANIDEAAELVLNNDTYADLIQLDQCLQQMAEKFPRLVQVIELRFFAGLSVAEVAQLLSLTTRSVERDWLKARAFISQFLEHPLA
jgi:RNA polymerase sigma factor (TIGR02999 family)